MADAKNVSRGALQERKAAKTKRTWSRRMSEEAERTYRTGRDMVMEASVAGVVRWGCCGSNMRACINHNRSCRMAPKPHSRTGQASQYLEDVEGGAGLD
jgi:hypothetical protein